MKLDFTTKKVAYEVVINGDDSEIEKVYEKYLENRDTYGFNLLTYSRDYDEYQKNLRRMFMVAEFFTNRNFEVYIRLKKRNPFQYAKLKAGVKLLKSLGEISDVIEVRSK